MSTIRSAFSNQFIISNFPSIRIVFHQLLTWIALGDVDLRFSPMLIRKTHAVEEPK
jgi:hypothetical protein